MLFEAAFIAEVFVFGPLGIVFGAATGCIFTIIRCQELEVRKEIKEKQGKEKKQEGDTQAYTMHERSGK